MPNVCFAVAKTFGILYLCGYFSFYPLWLIAPLMFPLKPNPIIEREEWNWISL